MDALLAAYRIGARVAWRGWSETAAQEGMPAATLARFAELVFAYIDELSAASAAGHTDELATSGRVRERYLEQLAQALLAEASLESLQALAERADWTAPATLTALLVPQAQVRAVLGAVERGAVRRARLLARDGEEPLQGHLHGLVDGGAHRALQRPGVAGDLLDDGRHGVAGDLREHRPEPLGDVRAEGEGPVHLFPSNKECR
jgi:hypothetical protein